MTNSEQLFSILTSWGTIKVTADETGVVRCQLPHRSVAPRDAFTVRESGRDPFSRYLRELLAGGNPSAPSIGKLQGTAFQLEVWNAIQVIPHGETRSYSALARQIGRPTTSCRAVANACGGNPVPLFIPCHRVIRANGDLGGFSCGEPWKHLLLSIEQLNRH